jgi:hypothetical protein
MISEPRSVKTVNELMFYCLLFGNNQPALQTLLISSTRARSPIVILPQYLPLRPPLTKFVFNFVLAKDHLAPSLADAHASAGAGAGADAGSAPPPPVLQ